jgi:hypothetical protein
VPDILAHALTVRLLRNGTIDRADVEAIADELDAYGEHDAAHAARAAILEVAAPSTAEWRRSKIRIIPDGGNTDG